MSTFYGKATTSEIRSSPVRDLNGTQIDFLAENTANLAWSQTQDSLIINGGSDITVLTGLRGALLKLKDEFFSGN